jgi:hypothetical protein
VDVGDFINERNDEIDTGIELALELFESVDHCGVVFPDYDYEAIS